MDDFIRNSTFAVIFDGDSPAAFVAAGWDALIDRIKSETWDGDKQPEWWSDFLNEIGDLGGWSDDQLGPFSFSTEIGEDCYVNVYRVAN